MSLRWSLFADSATWKGRTGRPLLSKWTRPKFDVALLCQTCQEREMDSYQGRSCTGQGWRGGADSRLTAAINHLHQQPDAGDDGEGGCWREWRSIQSLAEMSFCQPVPGGITCVINPSHHLSINCFFSRVKSVCDMPHLTEALRSGADASLIFFGSQQNVFTRGKWPTNVPTIWRLLKRQVTALTQGGRKKENSNILDFLQSDPWI